ncbi:MAG: polysaccharide deacetylase family protein [Peptostreptococcaceae bacterium]|jgi:peptidoglycan/xylan/chitin deacetylase (PgdA/CDA1 family)|nr:polysaccharide deacetylase family protein [Peptostreptococcaceae bacterium]
MAKNKLNYELKIKKKNIIALSILFVMLFVNFSFALGNRRVIGNVKRSKNIMSLTFDDWGEIKDVKPILDILYLYDVKATFFINGKSIDKNPKLLTMLSNSGHEIANHTYSHYELTKISDERIKKEILDLEKKYKDYTNKDLVKYLRPPYGAHSKRVDNIALNLGYENIVLWSIDTNDWRKKTANEISSHVINKTHPGGIVLMHILEDLNTKNALKDMIEGIYNKNYRLVDITNLINQDVKEDDTKISNLEFFNNMLYFKEGYYSKNSKEVYDRLSNYNLGLKSYNKYGFVKITNEDVLRYLDIFYPNKDFSYFKNIFAQSMCLKFDRDNYNILIESLKK